MIGWVANVCRYYVGGGFSLTRFGLLLLCGFGLIRYLVVINNVTLLLWAFVGLWVVGRLDWFSCWSLWVMLVVLYFVFAVCVYT